MHAFIITGIHGIFIKYSNEQMEDVYTGWQDMYMYSPWTIMYKCTLHVHMYTILMDV